MCKRTYPSTVCFQRRLGFLGPRHLDLCSMRSFGMWVRMKLQGAYRSARDHRVCFNVHFSPSTRLVLETFPVVVVVIAMEYR